MNIKAISAVVLPPKLRQIVVDHQAAKISNLSYFINEQVEVVWVPSENTLYVGPDAKPFKGDMIEDALAAAGFKA